MTNKMLKFVSLSQRQPEKRSAKIRRADFDEIYKKPIMGMAWSYLYYLVLVMVLFIVAFIMIDRYDFTKIQEE